MPGVFSVVLSGWNGDIGKQSIGKRSVSGKSRDVAQGYKWSADGPCHGAKARKWGAFLLCPVWESFTRTACKPDRNMRAFCLFPFSGLFPMRVSGPLALFSKWLRFLCQERTAALFVKEMRCQFRPPRHCRTSFSIQPFFLTFLYFFWALFPFSKADLNMAICGPFPGF